MPWILAGALLGLLSRLDKGMPSVDAGINTSATWVATAFVAGLTARRPAEGAVVGALTLTCANVAYYLPGVYGPVATWLAAGIAAGALFGLLGCAYRHGLARAALVPLAVAIAQGAELELRLLGAHVF